MRNPMNEQIAVVRAELARMEKESDLWKHGFESGAEWATGAILRVVGDQLGKEANGYVESLRAQAVESIREVGERHGWPTSSGGALDPKP